MINQGIYIFTEGSTGNLYVGASTSLSLRIQQHLRNNTFSFLSSGDWKLEVIQYPGASFKALEAIKNWKIRQLDAVESGYNTRRASVGLKRKSCNKKKLITEAVAMFKDGASVHKIANTLNRHPQTIRAYLRESGVWKTRSKLIADFNSLIEKGDVKALVDAGFSVSYAHRLTKKTRKQMKSDRNAEVIRRFVNGESQKSIAKTLGIASSTVSRVLGAHFFRKKVK